ncbi:Crp/Fnr family transcriptional regulator [Streptomyces millisiae]|uniref:Crp/Fnr family transcriptional regulator n=1 Tax=Streptomyces millisiae TaxID=3075542 RepID=A0ABU2LL50_9ACTN|nr:Crp/Fnr family transcriptional regulator [Streptomyces sp. DSM 44918]MDT0318286.1 Crp/Fnr family transcriptional regulator [Streptomyces sp. DSM 44918]
MSPSVSADTPPPHAALGAVPLLAGVPDDRLRELWAASVRRSLPAGRTLRHAGAPATHLLLLLRGTVAATGHTAAGRTVRYGESIGPRALDKVAVIDGLGHTATLTAVTPCAVAALPRDRFLALTDDAASVRRHVLRVLAAEARHQQARFTATATLPAEARLAAWLLTEAATRRDSAIPVGTQQDLADLLGLSRVTVNRALTRLRRDGLIAPAGRSVRVLAPELLRLRAAKGA